MKNKKYMFIMAIILIVLIILVAVQNGIIWNMTQEKNNNTNKENPSNGNTINYSATDDSKRFKQEYEKLNGTTDESNGETYNTVNIDENNPIVYVGLEELYNVINRDENSYIYVSAPTCTYCRASIETLLKVLKDVGIDKLYYYDITANEDAIEEGKRNEILNKLVEQELLTLNEEGNESWSIPLLAITNSGEVTLKEIGTSINYNEGQSKNSPLTDEQKQELYDHYYELLKK